MTTSCFTQIGITWSKKKFTFINIYVCTILSKKRRKILLAVNIFCSYYCICNQRACRTCPVFNMWRVSCLTFLILRHPGVCILLRLRAFAAHPKPALEGFHLWSLGVYFFHVKNPVTASPEDCKQPAALAASGNLVAACYISKSTHTSSRTATPTPEQEHQHQH